MGSFLSGALGFLLGFPEFFCAIMSIYYMGAFLSGIAILKTALCY
jgi:hypothetical protein